MAAKKKGSIGGLWYGDASHDLGSEPDLHVCSEGRDFLARHARRPPVLVDFGCWGGRHLGVLYEIAGVEGTVVGIDGPWAWARLGEALEVAKGLGAGVRVIQQELGNLEELETESVDGGLCWRVLHNLASPGDLEEALWEIGRVLRKGAGLVVAVRAATPDLHDMDFAFPQLTRTRPCAQAPSRADLYFTRNAAETLFKRQGFAIHSMGDFIGVEVVEGESMENTYLSIHLTRQ